MAPSLPRRVLIANRGEIALRILRTCHTAGVEAVAVHAEHDATAPHVVAAAAAVAVDSYMDVEALIAAAEASGCDAIHPGYGFLAENPEFARAVEDAGLTFVGPSAESMEVMGSKTESRTAMEAAGVPVVPGSSAGTPDELAEAAADLGFPVVIKAVAGGGGKGMAVVHDGEELRRQAKHTMHEAERSFGDDAIYVEKYLERPRHVEVQIFGDAHGEVVALGERECSIQRRHQKIVEESPSPAVDEGLRERMSAAAVAAAEAVDYRGAGTVEFLLAPDGEFFFLEMNTRLQVEHPVTEQVTGLDLVRLQLEVAGGASLPDEVRDICFNGHAIECRIYAEDPGAGHVPQTGTILRLREPTGPGIRVDSAMAPGMEVTVHYDPLLAKLIAWGSSRETAIERIREALSRFVVLGVRTNVDHLQDVVSHPAFLSGDLSTGFLEEHLPDWARGQEPPALALAATALPSSAGAAGGRGTGRREGAGAGRPDPWRTLGRFRLGENGGGGT